MDLNLNHPVWRWMGRGPDISQFSIGDPDWPSDPDAMRFDLLYLLEY